MKTKRTVLTLLLLIAVLALLPLAALAEGDSVFIGGLALVEGGYYVNGANGAAGTLLAEEPANGAWNAHYYLDTANNNAPTLAVKNLNLHCGDVVCIDIAKRVNLELIGVNTLTGSSYDGIVSVNGSTAITGTGSLTATSTGIGSAIFISDDASIDGSASVRCESGGIGMSVGQLTIKNTSASLTAISNSTGNECALQASDITFAAAGRLTAVSASASPFTSSTTVSFSGWGADSRYVITSQSADGSNPSIGGLYRYDAANRYLRIQPNDFVVSFDANEGFGWMRGEETVAGIKTDMPMCEFIPPDGMRFKEWAIGALDSATRVRAGGEYTFTADTVAYAIWEEIPTYTLTLNTTLDGELHHWRKLVAFDEDHWISYRLSKSADGVYANSKIPNGEYYIYADDNKTYYKIDVHVMDVIENIMFYSVTFEPNGGTFPFGTATVAVPDGSIFDAVAVNRGIDELKGWYKDPGFNEEWDFAVDTVTHPMTLYAKWTEVAPMALSTPSEIAWDTNAHMTATWSSPDFCAYSVQLYKDNAALGAPVSITEGERVCDLTPYIRESGSYTFEVIAKGDGIFFTDSDVSVRSAAYGYTKPSSQLSTPTNLAWGADGYDGSASWLPVDNANKYYVQLYMNGVALGSPVVTTDTRYSLYGLMRETGRYTFQVIAVGDSQSYATSVQSAESEAYDYVKPPIPLGIAGTPEWDTLVPGKVYWDGVTNASGYTLELRMENNNSTPVKLVTVSSDTFEYDFTSDINVTGGYYVHVTAMGDGTIYSDGMTSVMSKIYRYNKLSVPENPAWDTTVPGKATWTAVENAAGYTVQLAESHMAIIAPVTVASDVTEYDFTSNITETGSYTFTVIALGDGAANHNSDLSRISAAYAYTKPTLESISASFNQGTAVVYTSDTLESLKPMLTVTGAYSDGSAVTGITAYTLTGTLTAGTSTVTVTYNGKTATFNVTVTKKLPITFDHEQLLLCVSDKQQIGLIINLPHISDAPIVWTSSHTSVATVNAQGLVTAVNLGTATITAACPDVPDATASCQVTVAQLRTMQLPAILAEIQEEAFADAFFERIVTGEGLTEIASKAFKDCASLRIVEFRSPDAVIAEDAFDGCTDLIIVCPAGSTAEAYAKQHGFECYTR